MSRNISSHPHRDEKAKSSRNEEPATASRSRTEDEKQKRRREWLLQQEREREHERLKQKMILEYEIRRAREKGLPVPKRRSSHRSHSKSRSLSPDSRHRRPPSSLTRIPVMSEKVESSNATTPIFKGPEGTQISASELRRIKVDIHRNISAHSPTGELQRDILNPEDVVLKRREGEGAKPIFEREEIKKAVNTEEVEEHRTVVAIGSESLEGRSQVSKRRSVSLSPVRSHSSRHSSRRSRFVPELALILCERAELNVELALSSLSEHVHYGYVRKAHRPLEELLRLRSDRFSNAQLCFVDALLMLHVDDQQTFGQDQETACNLPDCMKIQSIEISTAATRVIGKYIAAAIEVRSAEKVTSSLTSRARITHGNEEIAAIIPTRGKGINENGTEIRTEGRPKTRDLIENIGRDRGNGRVRGETDLESVGFLRRITLNKFLFPFITGIFLQGR